MFGTLVDKATGWLSSELITTILLPVLAFGAGLGALIATEVGWAEVDNWWKSLTGLRQVLVCGGAVTALLIASWLVEITLPLIIRAYEGYRPSWMARPGVRFQTWRKQRLEFKLNLRKRPSGLLWRYMKREEEIEKRNRKYARYYRTFPLVGSVLPTRLGNVMRAAERYPNHRYGVDGVYFWPRLYGLLPDALLTPLGAARNSIERMLVLSSLSALFAVVAAVFAFLTVPLEAWLPCVGGAILLSFLAYRAAVSAAVGYGELIRAAYDTHRRELWAKVGWETQEAFDKERASWRRVSQVLYRGETDTAQPTISLPRKPQNGGTASKAPQQIVASEPTEWPDGHSVPKRYWTVGATGLVLGGLIGALGVRRVLERCSKLSAYLPSSARRRR
ncbi:hypothetical protein ACH492_38625 [Streptomyces sp. NPDC019443]|uniref:hypothetical protein n=1 Tax=Streptomyces sp. NPDC019443 TaxID=3365061 RepID=UPI0037B7D7B5